VLESPWDEVCTCVGLFQTWQSSSCMNKSFSRYGKKKKFMPPTL
jgi:hypothetical protein